MKKIELYVAADGTRFEDEEECIEYECNCELNTLNMKFFNYNNEEIAINKDNLAENAHIIKIPPNETKILANILKDYYLYFNADIDMLMTLLNNNDNIQGSIFYYDDDSGNWYNWTYEMDKLLKIAETVNK